ncbi:hypothetical protein G4228_001101 [Cervus hanglu yarkandensis]|nr:hypothetical protein G4228_001101 [Cervus hanglu yarkandensis]
MKLTIAIALVTLTLFCRPASTEVCPSLLYALGNLLIGTPASYEAALEPFNPDEDMKEATRQLKTLIDTLSPKTKDSVLNLMVHASSTPAARVPGLQCRPLPGICACSVNQSCPTLQPHGLQPARLLCPCNFPSKNTGAVLC